MEDKDRQKPVRHSRTSRLGKKFMAGNRIPTAPPQSRPIDREMSHQSLLGIEIEAQQGANPDAESNAKGLRMGVRNDVHSNLPPEIYSIKDGKETFHIFLTQRYENNGEWVPSISPVRMVRKKCTRWNSIDDNGVETVHMDDAGFGPSNIPLVPRTVFYDVMVFRGQSLCNKDLSESVFTTDLVDCDFTGGRFDGSVFGVNPMREHPEENDNPCVVQMSSVSFDNASLQDVVFDRALMSSVSFRGADLRGVTFNETCVDSNLGIDVTDSNITSQQIKSLLPYPQDSGDPPHIVYRHYSFDEVVAATSLSEQQFEFMVLSGAIEVRDKRQRVVKSGFDPELHHVPQWFV